MQRSQEKNPLFQQKKLNRKQKRQEKKQNKKPTLSEDNKSDVKPTVGDKLSKKKLKRKTKNKTAPAATEPAISEYTGVAAEPGVGTAMRSRWKLKEQALIHQQDVSVKKKEQRKAKQDRELMLEKKSIDRTKIGKKRGNEVDNFSFMVDKYKKLLDTRNADESKSMSNVERIPAKRSKWYVD